VGHFHCVVDSFRCVVNLCLHFKFRWVVHYWDTVMMASEWL